MSSGVVSAGWGQYLSSGVWRTWRGGPTPVSRTEPGAPGRANGAERIVIAHPLREQVFVTGSISAGPSSSALVGWAGSAAMAGGSAWGRARVGERVGSHWLSPAWGSAVCALDVAVWVPGPPTVQGAGLLRHRKATAWCHCSRRTGCVLRCYWVSDSLSLRPRRPPT